MEIAIDLVEMVYRLERRECGCASSVANDDSNVFESHRIRLIDRAV